MTNWSFWLAEQTLRRASDVAFGASTVPFDVEELAADPSPADVIMAAISDRKESD